MRFFARVILLIWLASATGESYLWPNSAAAIDRLPAELPSLNVSADDAIREAVRAVDLIEKELDRVRALARVLYDVREVDPRAYQPLVDRLEKELSQLQEKRQILAAGEILYHLKPDVVLRLCREIPEDGVRDNCLRYYVRAADQSPRELRPLVELVKHPTLRLECIQSLARKPKATLAEVQSAVREAKAVAGPDKPASELYSLAAALSRFPESEFDSVVYLVRAEFRPDEQVRIFGQMANQWGHWKASPAVATRYLDAAVELVPRCDNPEAAARMLLQCELARHRPRQALDLFDLEIEPLMKRSLTDSALPQLAPAGIEEVLTRCERISRRFGFSTEQFASHALRGVAGSSDPAPAVAWLRAAPASPLRDAAVAYVATGLGHRSSQGWDKLPAVQAHVDFLSKLVPQIEDRKERGIACEAVFNLTRLSQSQPVQIPPTIRDEFARLWPQLVPERRKWQVMQIVALLPEDSQREAIREAFQENDPRTAAAMIRDSSLADKEKMAMYRQSLDQVRAIPDGFKRSAALTAVSRPLQDVDPELSLQVLWEGLRGAQELKLGPQVHDVSDSLGSAFPCVAADECLRYAIDNRPAQPAKSIQALWSFARTMEPPAEREAVLEAAMELLLRQKETAKAAGVAGLIGDPERRVKAWTAIATVASGKELRSDW